MQDEYCKAVCFATSRLFTIAMPSSDWGWFIKPTVALMRRKYTWFPAGIMLINVLPWAL